MSIAEQCRRQGWQLFALPERIASREDFFQAIRDNLPLDPPLVSNRSWDALSDSLWSGLANLEEDHILLVWKGVAEMKASDSAAFEIASSVLADVSMLLADQNVTSGRARQFWILLTS